MPGPGEMASKNAAERKIGNCPLVNILVLYKIEKLPSSLANYEARTTRFRPKGAARNRSVALDGYKSLGLGPR
jgi:hypothetical protein